MKSKIIILIICALLGTVKAFAQNRTVQGVVLDSNNEPMIGATVAEVGNNKNGTIVDINGHFRLNVSPEAKYLEVSFVGYISSKVDITKQSNIKIVLQEDVKGIDEVVVVGYATQKKITATGATSAISAKDIRQIPTSSIQNALVGRLPGFFSQQRSGQPGGGGEWDQNDFYIRGVNSLNGDSQPLIIVDDIEYTYDQVQQLDVNEIETVTILKDASTTAIYGIRGANGVLVITTRRGKLGKPSINVSGDFGVQSIIRMPHYYDSYTSALLRNEALVNDAHGTSTPPEIQFDENDLFLFRNGNDPYGHANTNWTKELLNRTTTAQRANIDVSGGTNVVKYFVSFGVYNQSGMIKDQKPTDGYDDVNTNYKYNRTNFRTNLDIMPTKTTKIRFDMNGRFEMRNQPNKTNITDELDSYERLAPFMPLRNPDGSYSYASYKGGKNTVALNSILANTGYTRKNKNDFNIVIDINQDLSAITQGLSVKALYSYAGTWEESRGLSRDADKQLPAFYYDSETGTYSPRNGQYAQYGTYSQRTGVGGYTSTTTLTFSGAYDRTFIDAHHVYGLLLYNRRSYVSGGALPRNYIGLTGRVGYDFKQRYMVEFNVARNGNDMFQKGERYGIFPAISIGWNLAEESFFKKLFPNIDLFKVRGSYGLVGTDNKVNKPVTEQEYSSSGGGPDFGVTSGLGQSGTMQFERALVNPYVTWEKERKTDIGLEINMFKSRLRLTADYFYNYRYDQLIAQNGTSALMGQSVPAVNNGETENRGVDGSISWRDTKKGFTYGITATISYAKNKIIYISESPNYPWQAQTGRPIGVGLYYKTDGLLTVNDFVDVEKGILKEGVAKTNFDNAGIPQPGNIKFVDMDGDGVITEADKTYADKPNLPTTTYGLGLSFGYKGVSLNLLFQGATDYSVYLGMLGGSNYRAMHMDRYTPANESQEYPRLSVMGGSGDRNIMSWGTSMSDYWLKDAYYVRLKSAELSWQMPEQWFKNIIIKGCRLYATGFNLFTISNINKYQQDAEIGCSFGRTYPNTINFNFGAQLSF